MGAETEHKMNYKDHASPQQVALIEAPESRVLGLAGPGSGKTRTLIWRLQKLIQDGQDPAGICAVTFTNAGAHEVRERLAKASEQPVALGYLGTLHGFCLRELQKYGQPLGYGNRITVLAEEDAQEMLMEAAKESGCKASLKRLQEARREAYRDRGGKVHARTPEELAVATFLRKMRAAGAADFDALLEDFRSLLCQGYDTTAFAHLVVDEVQDSGEADIEIYERMPAANRFFIGDPDQAIYGFRGGEVRHILAMAKSDQWRTYLLEGNYRCRDKICRAANRLISHAQDRVKKWTAALQTDRPGTWTISRGYTTADAEAQGIAEVVRELLNEGWPASEIAVLARTNAVTNLCAETAVACGIPRKMKAKRRHPAEWRQLLAALDYLNDPGSDIAAGRWIAAHKGAKAAQELKVRAAVNLTPLSVLVRPDYAQALENANTANVGQGLARLGIGRGLIETAEKWVEAVRPHSLGELLLVLQREGQEEQEQGDGVTFTTMHAAKGREWDVVILAGMEQQTLPGRGDLEEERRVAYVGVTRAREVLILTHALARREPWGQKNMAPTTPSRFLEEITKPNPRVTA